MDSSPPKPPRILRVKRWLGPLRIPVGVLFLLLALFLILTPLTPGSLVTLLIGLELLDLREYAMKKLDWLSKRLRK